MREIINRNPWSHLCIPKKILAIRLQAMGDVVITLPYLQGLKNNLPNTQIDFLTREEVDDIPRNINLFKKVFSIGGGRNYKKMLVSALTLLPQLLGQNYDIVIDLQNNPLSRMIHKILSPKGWSEFDRYSPVSAGERTRSTIQAIGFKSINISRLHLKDDSIGIDLLKTHGWNIGNILIVLNPAGYSPTRNWPLDNYVDIARLFLSYYQNKVQFIILGTNFILEKANYLDKKLQPHLINLVNKTSPADAFNILGNSGLVLTEDSGLMHMAWGAGAPTLALFGSSRSDWSAPQGKHSLCLNSADLPCGECMQATCKFGDVHCLTRYTPEMVFDKALNLMEKSHRRELSN